MKFICSPRLPQNPRWWTQFLILFCECFSISEPHELKYSIGNSQKTSSDFIDVAFCNSFQKYVRVSSSLINSSIDITSSSFYFISNSCNTSSMDGASHVISFFYLFFPTNMFIYCSHAESRSSIFAISIVLSLKNFGSFAYGFNVYVISSPFND